MSKTNRGSWRASGFAVDTVTGFAAAALLLAASGLLSRLLGLVRDRVIGIVRNVEIPALLIQVHRCRPIQLRL